MGAAIASRGGTAFLLAVTTGLLLGAAAHDSPRFTDRPSTAERRELSCVASGSSYQELQFVGVVAMGTKRKALMLDRLTSLGYTVGPGDCVGRERALVDHLASCVTFRDGPVVTIRCLTDGRCDDFHSLEDILDDVHLVSTEVYTTDPVTRHQVERQRSALSHHLAVQQVECARHPHDRINDMLIVREKPRGW